MDLKRLPLDFDIESKKVLKAVTEARSALAELKGVVGSIPNESILINTLGLQEAKDSSEVENIITTHDELYKAGLSLNKVKSFNAKEVQNYISALKKGFNLVKTKSVLTSSHIIKIQEELEKNNAGYRKVPGTNLKNASTGEIIYTPPQDYDTIFNLMTNLIQYINDNELQDFDPIVKMSIIHFQFESIHPFYDGNGRTGRIINVLYLVMQDLLNLPILYLSSYIIRNKVDYYNLLQGVRDENNWEEWVLFMVKGVKETSLDTIKLIKSIKTLMFEFKYLIRDNYKFYSQDLLNNLFKHPYTKIEFIQNDLGVSRITAALYLNKLAEDGILVKKKMGNSNYYINHKLYSLLNI